jgi:hypothetical protein
VITMIFSRVYSLRLAVFAAVLFLTGCLAPNDHALQIGGPPVVEGETVSSIRAFQTRSFDTLETARLIEASAATLQDLGFTISTVSPEFGVLSGSKERDAVESGQVAVQFALVIIAALAGGQHQMVYDDSQQINVTIVVNKVSDTSSAVRVFFDRHITNNYGDLWKAEVIKEAEIYQQFFEKLSKSVFLEAHKI